MEHVICLIILTELLFRKHIYHLYGDFFITFFYTRKILLMGIIKRQRFHCHTVLLHHTRIAQFNCDFQSFNVNIKFGTSNLLFQQCFSEIPFGLSFIAYLELFAHSRARSAINQPMFQLWPLQWGFSKQKG